MHATDTPHHVHPSDAMYAVRTPLPADIVDTDHAWPEGTTLALRTGTHPDAPPCPRWARATR